MSAWQWAAWAVSAALLAWISRRALGNPRCHGFYRYFAFVAAALVTIIALPYWQRDIFSARQLLSWCLLFAALGVLIHALVLIKTRGGKRTGPRPAENYRFENTGVLITEGIFARIRHPMYSALMFYCWGALLKHPTWLGLAGAVAATVCLWLTATTEERENLAYFGEAYAEYRRGTKYFLPYVW